MQLPTILEKITFCIYIFILLELYLHGKFLQVGFLGPKVNIWITLFRYCKTPLHNSCSNLHSHQQCMNLPIFPQLNIIMYYKILYLCQYDSLEMVSWCSFKLNFSYNEKWTSSHKCKGHSYIFYINCLFMPVAYFSIWVALFISPLSLLNIVNIVFQVVICLLTLLKVCCRLGSSGSR